MIQKLLTVENVVKLVFAFFALGAMWNRLEGMEERVNFKIDASEQRTAARLDFLKYRIERIEVQAEKNQQERR